MGLLDYSIRILVSGFQKCIRRENRSAHKQKLVRPRRLSTTSHYDHNAAMTITTVAAVIQHVYKL